MVHLKVARKVVKVLGCVEHSDDEDCLLLYRVNDNIWDLWEDQFSCTVNPSRFSTGRLLGELDRGTRLTILRTVLAAAVGLSWAMNVSILSKDSSQLPLTILFARFSLPFGKNCFVGGSLSFLNLF